MTAFAERQKKQNISSSNEDALVNSVRILSEITQKDIGKLYNSSNVQNARTYYSNRYGETLKRT